MAGLECDGVMAGAGFCGGRFGVQRGAPWAGPFGVLGARCESGGRRVKVGRRVERDGGLGSRGARCGGVMARGELRAGRRIPLDNRVAAWLSARVMSGAGSVMLCHVMSSYDMSCSTVRHFAR